MSCDLDLSTERDVRAYLENTSYKSKDVIPLSGGTANYVFRLKLVTPYLGRDTLVLKHAKPYVKDHHMIALELDRQIYEVQALRVVRKWLPLGSVVSVPEVHLFDEAQHVIVMDDAGEGSMSLQTFVQQGRATADMAKEIGSAVGKFLAWLHEWGRGNEDARQAVRGNEWGKRMSAQVFYGDLKRVLVDKCRHYDPPVNVAGSKMEVLEKAVQETTKAILAEDQQVTFLPKAQEQVDNFMQFVMGDFWPGNLAVALHEDGALKQISVLDWELSKLGLAGIDVGQFSAELYLLRRCHRRAETATVMLAHFLEAYSPTDEQLRRAAVHLGCHLVVIPSFTKKGDSQTTRAVAAEGVEVVVNPEKAIVYQLRRREGEINIALISNS